MPDTNQLHSERSASAARIGATIEVRQDRTARTMVVFFSALAAAIAAGLWLGTFSRQEPVRGFVSAKSGILRVSSPGSGSISEVNVAQGDIVRQGQTLMTVKPMQHSSAAGKAAVSAIEHRNIERRQKTIGAEIEAIDALIAKSRADRSSLIESNNSVIQTLEAQERQLRNALLDAEDFLVKLKRLMASRDVVRERVAAQERTYRDYQRQLSELAARKTDTLREHTQRMLAVDTTLNDKANQRAALNNELATLDTELEQSKTRDSYTIVASRDGIVASIPVSPGVSVEANDVLVVLGDPAADQVLILEAPAKSIGLLQVGQRVVVKYDSFPYKTFGVKGGTIVSVPSAPIDTLAAGSIGAQTSLVPQAGKQTTFQLLVQPDTTTIMAYGEERKIALGSTLTADIIIERRRLIDWVLDPIRAMRGRT